MGTRPFFQRMRDELWSQSWPHSARDVLSILRSLLNEALEPLVKQAREKQEYGRLYFWTSRTAVLVYTNVALAVLLQRSWILFGSALILTAQVFRVCLRWVLFIVDDQEVRGFVDFVSVWVQLFLREGEKVLSGENAIRYIMAGSVLMAAPTGVSYFRYILRYNTQQLNQRYIHDISEDIKRYRFAATRRMKATGSRIKKAGTNLKQTTTRTGKKRLVTSSSSFYDTPDTDDFKADSRG